MKLFSFFLLIIIYSSSIYSTEIVTFKLSYIIDNSLEYNEFINKLDTLKTRMQNEILEDENKLIDENTLMFVALHELAHIATESIGHTKEFWANFKFKDFLIGLFILILSLNFIVFQNFEFGCTI